jgi:hypothetical protein
VKRVTYAGDTSEVKTIAAAPASHVHIDYSYAGAWQRFDTTEANRRGVSIQGWDELKQHRWAVLSIWRPLRTITRDPLAMGDKQTVPDAFLTEVELTHQDGAKHGLWQMKYKPDAKFYYLSQMEPHEVVAIKLFDTKEDGRARGTPHTAFQTAQDYGPPRNSIETRCMVFWEGETAK